MLKTVIIGLLILHSGICLQDAADNVENTYPEKKDPDLAAPTPNVKSDPDTPISNTVEDPDIKVLLPQTANKAPAGVGLSPEQIDALADKILQIHGVQPQIDSPQDYAKVQRLRNVVSNVESKLENKLKEVAEQANDNPQIGETEEEKPNVEDIKANTEQANENPQIGVTGEEKPNVEDIKESNSQTNNEDNGGKIEQEAVAEEAQDEQNNEVEIENNAVAEGRQDEKIEVRETEEKHEPVLPLEVAPTENKTDDEAVTNNEEDSKNLESDDNDETPQEQDLNIDDIQKEESVANKVTEEETQENILKKTDAYAVNDTVTNSEEELKKNDIEQEQMPTENDNQFEQKDTNEEVAEEDSSDLKGSEEETEENIDNPDITPILTLGQIQLNSEKRTSEESINNVGQVDVPNLDSISPTPSFKEENLNEEIVKTRDISSPEEEEEEEDDETDLETCNTDDCDKKGKNHLYSAENNQLDEEQLEAKTENGYFSKILNFIGFN